MKAMELFAMRVVNSTLPFHRRCQSKAAALSLAHHVGEVEAPSLRLGPRLGAPRFVAMARLLDRIIGLRKR